jgi:hypothetical protein
VKKFTIAVDVTENKLKNTHKNLNKTKLYLSATLSYIEKAPT